MVRHTVSEGIAALGQAPFTREEPREVAQVFGISEGLSGLTWLFGGIAQRQSIRL